MKYKRQAVWLMGMIGMIAGLCLSGCGPKPMAEPDSEAAGDTAVGAHPLHVTAGSFQQVVLERENPVVVDFWAPWCGPCRQIAPVLEELAAEFEGRVTVCKVNVDDHQALASQYAIRSIPALLAFENGEVVDQRVGSASEQDFREWFNSLL